MEELCRWITRAPIDSALAEVRGATKKEVDARLSLVELETTAVPAVGTRAMQQSARSGVFGGGAAAPSATVVDPFDYIDQIDLTARLAVTNFAALCLSSKWSDKREAIDIAADLIGKTPKLKPDAQEIQALMRTLKPLANHTHQAVSIAAIKLIGCIGEGLRSKFGSCCNELQQFRVIVGRLKDKKLVPVIGETLNRMVMAGAISVAKVADDLPALLDPKKQGVVHARVAVLCWLTFCIGNMVGSSARSLPASLKVTIFSFAKSALDAAEPAARLAGEKLVYAVCGASDNDPHNMEHQTLIKLVGEMKGSQKRVSECALRVLSGVESGALMPTGAKMDRTGPTASAAHPSGPKKFPPQDRDTIAAPKLPPVIDTVPSSTLDPDECTDLILSTLSRGAEEGWSATARARLNSSKWQGKVEGFIMIAARCRVCSAPEVSCCSEALVIVAESKTKGWKDNNVYVVKSAFDMLNACADACTTAAPFHRDAAAAVVPVVIEKLADRKTKDSALSLLTALMEVAGPSLVMSKVGSAISEAKSTVAIATTLEWTSLSIIDFGAALFPLKSTCRLAHSMLSHRDSKVRAAALNILGALYKSVGPRMRVLALPGTLTASQSKSIEETLGKARFDPLSADCGHPKRKVKSTDGSNAAGIRPERIDLSTLLDIERTIGALNDTSSKDAWKIRKSALDEVLLAIDLAGHFVEANKHTFAILRNLKKRVNDTQTNLKPLAVGAIAVIVRALDVSVVPKALKAVADELVAGIQDNKKVMRDKVIQALDQSILRGGAVAPGALDALLPAVCTALHRSIGRFELLAWLASRVEEGALLSSKAVDSQSLLPPIMNCLSDKATETRCAANRCLSAFVAANLVGKDEIQRVIQDLAPSTKRTIQPAVDSALQVLTVCARTAAVAPKDKFVVSNRPGAADAEVEGLVSEDASSLKDFKSCSAKVTPGVGGPIRCTKGSISGLRCTTQKVERQNGAKCGRGWAMPPEDPGSREAALLEHHWSEYLSEHATKSLFPEVVGKMECACPGMNTLEAALAEDGGIIMEHLDFILKWLSIRLCERESVSALQRMLTFTVKIFTLIVGESYMLSELEANVLVPYILDRSGHGKPRFRTLFKEIMTLLSRCYPVPKYVTFLLSCCHGTKKAPSKIMCLDDMARLIDKYDSLQLLAGTWRKAKVLGGTDSEPSAALCAVAKFVESNERDLRSAALRVLVTAHRVLHYEADVIFDLLSAGQNELSPKALVLITERLKSNTKDAKLRNSPRLRKPQSRETMHSSEDDTKATKRCQDKSSSEIALNLCGGGGLAECATLKPVSGSPDDFPEAFERSTSCAGSSGRAESVFRYEEPPPSPALSVPMLPKSSKRRNRRRRKSGACHFGDDALPSFQEVKDVLTKMLALPDDATEHQDAYVQGRDMIKQIYAFASTWPKALSSNDTLASFLPPTAMFAANSDEVMVLVARCMSKAFVCGPVSKCRLDNSLLALSLATISSLIRASDCAALCSAETIEFILGETCQRMLEALPIEDRAGATLPGGKPALSQTMLQALNRVSVEMASHGRRTTSVASLLRLMAKHHNPECGETHVRTISLRASPSNKLTSIFAKLLLHVMDKEKLNALPYSQLSLYDLVSPLDLFFGTVDVEDLLDSSRRSQNNAPDRTRVEAVKSLLIDIMKHRGELSVVTALDAAAVAKDALTRRLVASLAPQYCVALDAADTCISEHVKQFSRAFARCEGEVPSVDSLSEYLSTHVEVNLSKWMEQKQVHAVVARALLMRLEANGKTAQLDCSADPPVTTNGELSAIAINRIKERLSKQNSGECALRIPSSHFSICAPSTIRAPLTIAHLHAQPATLLNIHQEFARAGRSESRQM